MISLLGAALDGLEFKRGSVDLPEGEFTGYGAVFGNLDSHGDVIERGAFADSLAERMLDGRRLPMHVMHGRVGDGLPVGVWKATNEDARGLRVHGKISGMNTQAGRLHYERLKDRAYGGLSIGYRVSPGGSTRGCGEVKRHLRAVELVEISLVDQPSNAQARVDEMKRLQFAAAGSLVAAMEIDARLHFGPLDRQEKANALSHLIDAFQSLTGIGAPDELFNSEGGAERFADMLERMSLLH